MGQHPPDPDIEVETERERERELQAEAERHAAANPEDGDAAERPGLIRRLLGWVR